MRTGVRIAVGVGIVVAAESAILAASRSFVGLDLGTLGVLLVATGTLVLGGTLLMRLGPAPYGGLRTPSRAMLVSSGLRFPWDYRPKTDLHGRPSRERVALGVGGVLFLLGLMLAAL
jgi:hypothetical protein